MKSLKEKNDKDYIAIHKSILLPATLRRTSSGRSQRSRISNWLKKGYFTTHASAQPYLRFYVSRHTLAQNETRGLECYHTVSV